MRDGSKSRCMLDLTKNNLHLMIILVLCVFLQANLVHAEYVVAVSRGDWVKYDITTSTPQSNETAILEIDIDTVQGTTIAGTYQVSVQGQRMIPSGFEINVTAQSSNFLAAAIIPANLALGDTIPSEGVVIQNVTEWNGRNAVVADAPAPYLRFTSEVYWDQATGVFLEATGSLQSNGTSNGSFEIVLTGTSLWSTEGFNLDPESLATIAVAVAIVALVVVVLISRRRKAQSVQSLPQTPHTGQPKTQRSRSTF
jgi:hypothetical protein